MRFDLYHPCSLLKPYIRYFAFSELAEEHTYKVLPDTGLVMGFQYRGRLSLIDHTKPVELSLSGLTGLHDTWRVFKNSADTGTILVYFREGGAAAFFKEPVYELFGKSVSLDNFMLRSELELLEEQLQEVAGDSGKINIVEQFLLGQMKPTNQDRLIGEALAWINKIKGNMRITDLLKQLHVSQSSLEKRFRQVVGTSPKKYSSIVRLKHVIQHYRPGTSLTATAYDAGFYDQAHFIKEFRTFTGESPEIFFRSE
jgi:AraC-like DNA-binding protein